MTAPVEKLRPFSPAKRLMLRFFERSAFEVAAIPYTSFLIVARILQLESAVGLLEDRRESVRDLISDGVDDFLGHLGRRF